MTAMTYTRATRGMCSISVHDDNRRRGVELPGVFQHGPQHLIDVLVAAAARSPQDPFGDGADLPQRGVRAAVADVHARFEAARADRREHERSRQVGRLPEGAGASYIRK